MEVPDDDRVADRLCRESPALTVTGPWTPARDRDLRRALRAHRCLGRPRSQKPGKAVLALLRHRVHRVVVRTHPRYRRSDRRLRPGAGQRRPRIYPRRPRCSARRRVRPDTTSRATTTHAWTAGAATTARPAGLTTTSRASRTAAVTAFSARRAGCGWTGAAESGRWIRLHPAPASRAPQVARPRRSHVTQPAVQAGPESLVQAERRLGA
jgi:hypothetical protein